MNRESNLPKEALGLNLSPEDRKFSAALETASSRASIDAQQAIMRIKPLISQIREIRKQMGVGIDIGLKGAERYRADELNTLINRARILVPDALEKLDAFRKANATMVDFNVPRGITRSDRLGVIRRERELTEIKNELGI